MLFVAVVDDPLGAMSDNIPLLLRDCIADEACWKIVGYNGS